jgi:hypothetical protein
VKPAIEKGEKCYNARLTAEQVHEARILVMKGPIGTLPQIARRWGVEKQTLRNAVAGKNWKWLPLPTPEEIENTPLPNWIEAVGAPHRSHCGTSSSASSSAYSNNPFMSPRLCNARNALALAAP